MSDGLAEAEGDLDQLSGLELCLACFGLRGLFGGKDHRCKCQPLEDGWREGDGEWAGYDIPLLVEVCRLCVRGTMKSGSRWTNYACSTCMELNVEVGRVFGAARGALPLGRHSMMTGIYVPKGGPEEGGVAATVSSIKGLLGVWQRLAAWKVIQGAFLVGEAGWNGRSALPWAEWHERFPNSKGASAEAFCGFAGYDLPEHRFLDDYRAARAEFLGGGK